MEYNHIIADYLGSLHCWKQSGVGYAIHLKPERNIMNISQMAPNWVALAAALDLLIAVLWWHDLDLIGFTAELNKLELAHTSTTDQEVQP